MPWLKLVPVLANIVLVYLQLRLEKAKRKNKKPADDSQNESTTGSA